jgi:hypothetical protein
MTQEQTLITTTLNRIRAHSPCEDAWEKLLKHLGKTKADDEPIKFSTIIESNGLDDALWCLRSIYPEHDKEVRLFAADCAEQVLHLFEEKYPNDNRPRLAIEAARKFANGEITREELDAARAAAWDAAWAATWDAARASARASAWAAAWDAAWAATWDAAWAAQTKMMTERFS